MTSSAIFTRVSSFLRGQKTAQPTKGETTKRGRFDFESFWKGAQLDYCDALEQPCLYAKSVVIFSDRTAVSQPICPGCIYTHSAGKIMSLAEDISRDGSKDEEE
jgi:hypothetical protein